jgi:hypothetical protein
MTAPRSLPPRPSLESLRKQAKALARDVATGDADAIARARVHQPRVDLPLTLRNAQLVIAREYGFPGWQDLVAEVSQRLGQGLAWAAAQARRVIHDNDVERLKQLLTEYPALLTWRADSEDGGLLGMATDAYGDSFDPERERTFTRRECAELLLDAGAIVMPSVCEGLLESRTRGLLELFRRRDLLPHTLKFASALGDLDAVRIALDREGNDRTAVEEAFLRACSFEHQAVASLLLDQCIALDPELGKRIDGGPGRAAFLRYFCEERSKGLALARAEGPWQTYRMDQVVRALEQGDLAEFARCLDCEPWLLGDGYVGFQADRVAQATLNGRGDFIVALLDLDPALLRQKTPPPSQAIEFAFTYAHTHLLPLLTRIWPVPDDLPHAAGLGDLARVKRWFDESGAPRLGDLDDHYPYHDARARGHLDWDPPTAQQVLDTALAFAVTNHHFEVADFLLEHGANIDTDWNSHEPASLLHHLVFLGDYEAMRFVIDHGIDMTIRDYRWNSTAKGWARYAKNDEEMVRWLEAAERRRSLE